jgi:hypothetical protein
MYMIDEAIGDNSETLTIRKDVSRPAVQEISADICVVGAGMAGVSAALEAAGLGHKVVLIDGLPTLGGQAVNSKIGLFCGIFSNPPNPRQFTHGIADDMLRDLGAQGALHYLKSGLGSVIYDDLALARWIEKAVQDAGITVILGGVLRGVANADRRIRSVEVATRYGDLRVAATGFIDATGDAALTWQAGLPCREPASGGVYGTHMVVIDGIDFNNQPARAEFVGRLEEKAHAYGLERKDGLVFLFPEKELAFVNMTHEETPLEPLAASVKSLEGKKQAEAAVEFLRKEFPIAFGKAKIRAYGLAGIRQTRWIVGSQQLTVQDVNAGLKFKDAIARTAWPMELHGKSGYAWHVFPKDHVHYIPFGSLTPPGVDNLVAAGRCIDADLGALSSIRVMGPCIATGAAVAHALDLAGTGSVHKIDIAALQKRLRDNIEDTD